MPKNKIYLVGILLVFCLAGQWLLRTGQATADSPESQKSPTLDISKQNESLLSAAEQTAESQDSDDLRRQLIRQLITMIVFVALIGFGVWWFAKRYSKGLMGGKGKLVTVTETVPLGPRKMVHILQIGSRKLLLGSTSDSIRFLADVTEAIGIPSNTEGSERGQVE